MHSEIVLRDIEEIVSNVNKVLLHRLSNKTLLITGPNGLLASYIVDTIAYLNDNQVIRPCKVIGLHRSPIKKTDRLGHLLGREDIQFIQHDVSKPLEIEGEIHFLVHAAGRSSPKVFVNDPIGTIDVNVTALRWLLDLAVMKRVESFAYFSSGEIYGNPPNDKIPTPETYNGNTSCLAPRSCYTESKRCGEAMCMAFHKTHKVPVKIFRPMLVYGPGLSTADYRVMGEFMRGAIEDKSIVMSDEGKSIRCYCYVTDAIVMFWDIFLSDKNGEVFNMGNQSEPISIRELADLILKLCGVNKQAEINPQKHEHMVGAPDRVCPDMTKTIIATGYEPKVKLPEGLKRTIQWNRGVRIDLQQPVL